MTPLARAVADYDRLSSRDIHNDQAARPVAAQGLADALRIDLLDAFAMLADALATRATKELPCTAE